MPSNNKWISYRGKVFSALILKPLSHCGNTGTLIHYKTIFNLVYIHVHHSIIHGSSTPQITGAAPEWSEQLEHLQHFTWIIPTVRDRNVLWPWPHLSFHCTCLNILETSAKIRQFGSGMLSHTARWPDGLFPVQYESHWVWSCREENGVQEIKPRSTNLPLQMVQTTPLRTKKTKTTGCWNIYKTFRQLKPIHKDVRVDVCIVHDGLGQPRSPIIP